MKRQLRLRKPLMAALTFAAVTGLTLGLAGCSAGGSSSSSNKGPDAVLTVSMSDGSINDTLDPLRLERAFQIVSAGAIYESLVDVDEQLKAVPRLAESFETTDDGTTWVFKLRRDVTFHDGSPLTSKDVVSSISRAINPDEGSGNSLAGQLDGILAPDGIVAVDDLTVQFNLETPYVFFPNAMATRFARIYPADTTNFDSPVGTGPFQFESFTPGDEFKATRYDGYWGSAPDVKELDVVNYADETTRQSAFLDGDTDVYFDMSPTAATTVQKDSSFSILEQQNAGWIPLAMDSTVEPFNNPDVIKAIKAGIDRQALIDVALGGFGTIGYDTPIPEQDANFGGLPTPTFDADAAKKDLADAGYPDGVNLPTLTVLDNPQEVSVALVLQQQLAAVGVNFEIEREPASTYWDNSWLKKPFYMNGYQQRTADEILKLAFVSDGAWNMSKRSDPDVDAAVTAAGATTDESVQKQEYAIAQELIAERDTTVVPVQTSRVSGLAPGLTGVTANAVYYLDFGKAAFSG